MTTPSRSAILVTCAAGLCLAAVARADAPSGSVSASTSASVAPPASASAKPPLPALPAGHAAVKPVPSAPPPKTLPPATTAAPKKTPPSAARPTKAGARPTPGVRSPDPAARRGVAGGPTADDVALGAETPELRALYRAELEIFPPAIPPLGSPWPNELASPLSAAETLPHVHASGLPPSPPTSGPKPAEGGHDVSWLAHLQLPDLPVRWDARLVRYLEFYKDDPRGRQLFAFWMKRSGRYREAIRRSLRRKALPEDLAWLAMVESGYDPTARSPAGAAGLWQLTADTAHLYGLSTDRWADQRLNALAETEAAAEMLSDLYRRFGSWELAMAGYNMGYGAVMSVVRRYNTNDYWALSRLEAALPWETVLYVPKVVATAIVGRNLAAFGFADLVTDPPIDGDETRVAPGTSLQAVALAAGCTLKEVESLNPELRAGRTPPGPVAAMTTGSADGSYPVRVPTGKGATAQANLSKTRETVPPFERYVVKFGESLEQVAASHKVPVARITELNAIAPGEVIRGGTVLLVPRATVTAPASNPSQPAVAAATDASKAVVVVPPEAFIYPDRRRVFYRVLTGDTLPDIARNLHVEVDDLRRWNDLDPAARLQEGMTLQVFVPQGVDLSHAVLLAESDARVLVAGSDGFFAYTEGTRGRRRLVVTAKAGDTLESIGRVHGVNAASMERINGRGRKEALKEGQTVVVYVPAAPGATPAGTPGAPGDADSWPMPAPNGPLPPAPEARLLPDLP